MSHATNGSKTSLLDTLLDEAAWLITHADSLKFHRREQEANAEWLRAAVCEQQAACLLEVDGHLAEAAVHRVSSASCYALADCYTEAVTLARSALSLPIPDSYREEIQGYFSEWLAKAKKQVRKNMRKQAAAVVS